MAEGNKLRLNKVLRELNISLDRAVEHLAKNGHEIEARPTTKISDKEYQILFDGFQTQKSKEMFNSLNTLLSLNLLPSAINYFILYIQKTHFIV
jgi:hypothetical protein